MRRACRPSLATALLLLIIWAPQAAAPLQLGVMTFNIRTAMANDGGNGWMHRKELVVDMIRQVAPQVMGLQEVVDEQIEFLASALREYRWLGIDRGLNGGQGLSEYTPIFYRHAEVSPLEAGNFWLSATPDVPNVSEPRGRFGRIVTWARFHHLATGRSFYVFNTHFVPRSGPTQLAAARIIAERLRALPVGAPVIVLGDFNAPAGGEVWRELAGDLLKDAWLMAAERRGPPVTMGGFGPPPEGDTTRIDWIMVGGPIDVRSAETVLFNRAGRYPSDHYPVAARVAIR